MQTVSDRWDRALASDHGIATKVNVLYDGLVVAEDIPFTEGTVKVDRGSEIRRSLSLSLADPGDFPMSPDAPYAVYGQRIYVETGIRYPDGSTEMVPAGTFVITSVSGDIHIGPLVIEGAGLETIFKRSAWGTAESTGGYTSAAGFIRYHVTDIGADFVDRSTHGSDPIASKTWEGSTDKWSSLTEVATSVGCELFCDAAGTFVLADIPDPSDLSEAPVWDVTTGSEGVMVSAEMTLTADDVYNRIVVTGENAEEDSPPVQGEARITDPADPLVYGGPFGQVTKTYSSSLITDSAQANATASALLAKYRSPNKSVTLQAVPNPALDAGDRIRVDYGEAHPPEIHIAHSFDIPLEASDGGFTIHTVSGKEDPDAGQNS